MTEDGTSLENLLQNSINWEDLGRCKGLPTELFFDEYKSNVARQVDILCKNCPVRKRCRSEGQNNYLTGVWGGIYLEQGNVDLEKNFHKTAEILDFFLND